MPILRNNVKVLREEKRLKQQELANLINVRRETIVHLENEKYNPSLKMAMDLSKVLNRPLDEIFYYSDDDVD